MIRVLVAAAALLASAPPASADPTDCFDPRLCSDPGQVYYCPDTGQFGSIYAPCPSLVTGPYQPGGLTPNEGLAG